MCWSPKVLYIFQKLQILCSHEFRSCFGHTTKWSKTQGEVLREHFTKSERWKVSGNGFVQKCQEWGISPDFTLVGGSLSRNKNKQGWGLSTEWIIGQQLLQTQLKKPGWAGWDKIGIRTQRWKWSGSQRHKRIPWLRIFPAGQFNLLSPIQTYFDMSVFFVRWRNWV